MGVAFLVLSLQAAIAYLAMDLLFRFVAPESLPRRWALYGTLALVTNGFGLWLTGQTAGLVAVIVASPGPVLWWLIWRFGMRKQLTFLYKTDNGRPLEAKRPDP